MYTALDHTCLYSFEFCEPGLAGSPSTLRLQLFQICTPSWDYRGLFTLFLIAVPRIMAVPFISH